MLKVRGSASNLEGSVNAFAREPSSSGSELGTSSDTMMLCPERAESAPARKLLLVEISIFNFPGEVQFVMRRL